MAFFDGLKKLGLVQDEGEIPEPVTAEMPEEYGPEVEIDTSTVGGETAGDVLQSVYGQDVFEESTSIFRMQDFINSLPKEMPTQTKYVTIGSILNASRIDILDLIADAKKRLTLLGAAEMGVKAEHESLCEEANKHIADFLAAIEVSKVQMQDSQAQTTHTCDILNTESAQVKQLLDFAEGVIDSMASKET